MTNAALPKEMSPKAVAFYEAQAWLETVPSFYNCKENADALNNWLAARNLSVTAGNLQAAYESLLENGQLHTSPPDPRQPGPQVYRKAKVKKYTGSRYDRTEIMRLRREMALMDAQQFQEFMALNGWDDIPHWLKG